MAAGTSLGTVTLYDISTGPLMATQRLQAPDAGPVSELSACLPVALERRVAVAEGTRPLDGGGVVDRPVGLPWRLTGAVSDMSHLAFCSTQLECWQTVHFWSFSSPLPACDPALLLPLLP